MGRWPSQISCRVVRMPSQALSVASTVSKELKLSCALQRGPCRSWAPVLEEMPVCASPVPFQELTGVQLARLPACLTLKWLAALSNRESATESAAGCQLVVYVCWAEWSRAEWSRAERQQALQR